jgi:exodeoxyribonuclease VII large subunit
MQRTLFDEFDETEPLTVTQLNAEVRGLLEDEYADVAVVGEISNLKRHTSGHVYFRLKDDKAQIDAACFRREAERIDFDLQDGMEVLARGRVTLYEAWGRYQLVAYAIEQTGYGRLEIEFRKLKERLQKEGLFDEEHKKPLPRFPMKAAVVTSPTGAAVRDIVSTCRRRWPALEILVCPVLVQGNQAPADIVAAFERLQRVPGLDVVIVGRGGGSLEDLWAFNDERVARAIFDCDVPVISSVGHETDFTIADFVADVRAATPTMAAELATPLASDVRDDVTDLCTRILQHARRTIETNRSRLQEYLRSYALGRVRGVIEQSLQRNDFVVERLQRLLDGLLRTERMKVDGMMTRLADLDPRTILGRGYAICSDESSRRLLRSSVAS